MVSNRKGSAAKAKDGTAWVGIGKVVTGCSKVTMTGPGRQPLRARLDLPESLGWEDQEQ